MRLNDVALVRSQVVAILTLTCEYVEVVEPEIVHHLLQLAVAVYGARNFGHPQFSHDALRPFAVVSNGTRHIVWIAPAKRVACASAVGRELAARLIHLHGRRSIVHFLFCWSAVGILLRRLTIAASRCLPHVPGNR